MVDSTSFRRRRKLLTPVVWGLGIALCLVVNPENDVLGLTLPAWISYLIACVYGLVCGYMQCEYRCLGALSGAVTATCVLTVIAYLAPGVAALKRDQVFYGRFFFILVGIAPGYCLYHVGKEIIETVQHTDSRMATSCPQWRGTPTGRSRRLLIIGMILVAVIAVGTGFVLFNQ